MWIIILVLQYFLTICIGIKPNILLIVVDDLRPALGCYGDINAHTPNIDKLAEKSILFTRAYAQQSLCAPSRNSFLTSRRPDSLHLYDFYSYWRDSIGNFTTLPQYLKDQGYITKSVGKIFHPGISSNHSDDSPYSWSQVPFHPYTNKYKNAAVCSTPGRTAPMRNIVCPVNVSSTPGGILPDMESLNAAKLFLNSYKSEKGPFFLAVGFDKPHIPLKYPKQYTKYHPLDKFKIKNYNWSDNVSSVAYNPWTDLRKRQDIDGLRLKFPWEKIPEDYAKKIIQSYYSAVSYIDDLIGILINQLQLLKLDKNTIIIITSDHGWSLGEHAQWAKYSNFEVAVRVPLIVSLPRDDTIVANDTVIKLKNNHHGKVIRTNSIVELVDLFPSIADLAGFKIPICPEEKSFHLVPELCSEGISFVPVIRAAMKDQTFTWKKAAFSQYPRPGLVPTWKPNSDEPRLNDIKIMGYTLRTNRFRYTAWITFNQTVKQTDANSLIAEELYDHKFDPDELINQNNNSITYFSIKKKLKKMLRNGWRKALPKVYVS